MGKFTGIVAAITAYVLIAISVQAQSLKLDGVTVIQLKLSEGSDNTPVNIEAVHSFPGREYTEVHDTLSSRSSIHFVQYPVRTSTDAWINIGSTRRRVLLMPGDTISVLVEGAGEKRSIDIGGKNKLIQNYYEAKDKKFKISTEQLMWNLSVGTDLKTYMMRADSLYATEQKFLVDYRKITTLPSWFVRYEADAIRYLNAHSRLYVQWYKAAVNRESYEVPAAYYAFLNNAPLQNAEALYDRSYLMFLDSYFFFKTTDTYKKEYDQNALLELARKALDKKSSDFYILYNISQSLVSQPQEVIKDLERITFPDSYQGVVKYIKQKADSKIDFLGPGDSAPEFFLENTVDSLVSLNQFRDSIVYLSFWFAGCKGCVEEFPRENDLVRKFQDKPVKIISICTRTKKDKWLSTIDKYQLQMENLYANKGWIQKLEDQYAILAYPHYVLIGADGKVIENYASRPGDIGEKIEKAVTTMPKK